MSESIAETILPGTYIEVRAEGLIGVGSIATGNIGIVGTAARGPRNQVVPLGGFAEAIDAFGAYDAASTTNALTLVRALELAFRGGARDVYAVRIANGDPVRASTMVKAPADADAFRITAKDAGTYGNAIRYSVVTEGPTGSPTFKLTLTYRNVKEVYSGGNVGAIQPQLAASRLVDAGSIATGAANLGLAPVDPAAALGAGTGNTPGTDLANVSNVDVAAGLAALENQPINILVVAGMGSDTVRGVVADHLERTENEGRERIAVLGPPTAGSNSDFSDVSDEADAIVDDRIALVAPGVRAVDASTGQTVSLPPPYLAALIAGKLATVAPHVSLTNKTVPVDDLDVHYSTTVYKNLLQRRVLLVRKKFGFQVVRGITTDNGAFKQVSVRRIVDYAKAGVRLGSDPYIGRLNNARVRAALKATLDGFLSQMVLDEMLVSYELEVTATRSEEIQGIARVTMTLRPTFSIDFIRVTMNLQ
ncbi:MAG TPA: phage tail sheath C-terminal domain-containing protein [Kofleriaceae bacterium]|nr:phage tail sheath C-terminal domain-containing protein [Kofleriaceae bacterium]